MFEEFSNEKKSGKIEADIVISYNMDSLLENVMVSYNIMEV